MTGPRPAILRAAARLLALAALLGLTACGKPEPLRLGFVGELSDASSDVARSARNGAQLALEPWVGASAPQGRAVEMLVRDLGKTPAEAEQVMAELAAARVAAVIGSMTSGGTTRLLPLAEKHGLLLISPTATAMVLHGKDDALFRINGTTRDNGLAYARRCLAQRGLRTLGVAVTSQNSAFAENWLREFQAAYEGAGGRLVHTVRFDAAAGALASTAAELLARPAPDGLVIVGNAVDAARLAQQVRKLDARRPILVVEWAATEELIELGGQAVEGVELLQLYDRDDQSPRYAAFREAYSRRFKEPPGYASVAGHDAATVLLSALDRSPGTDTLPGQAALKDALRQKGPFDGLQQRIAFDVNGDTTRRAFFVTVRGGRFVRAE